MSDIDREARLAATLGRLRHVIELQNSFDPPPPTQEEMRQIADDLAIVLEALARYRFGPPWLIRYRLGPPWLVGWPRWLVPIVSVQWRGVEGELYNRDFDTEAEARAFGATKADEPLQFQRDLETAAAPVTKHWSCELTADERKERERLKATYPDAFFDGEHKGAIAAFLGELHHPEFPDGFVDWPYEKQTAWYAGWNEGVADPFDPYRPPETELSDDAQGL
jgi:hypothetical protein